MRTITMIIISVAFWAAFFIPAAQAQNQCDKRAAILEMLSTRYSEKTQSLGVTNKGGLIEVLTSKDGSTWTIIVTTPLGVSCLVAAGEGWRSIDKTKGDGA